MLRTKLAVAYMTAILGCSSFTELTPRLIAQRSEGQSSGDQLSGAQVTDDNGNKGPKANPQKQNVQSAKQPNLPQGKVLVYKQSAGVPREIELFFPPNHDPKTSKAPGIIFFHGGGWSGGVRTQFSQACQYFASRGMVAATVTYRMLSASEAKQLPTGETRKRVCITDAKSAIRWFKQKSPELGLDPQRVVAGGGSAGGHIAVLATNTPELNDDQDPQSIDTSVVAYVLFNPAFTVDDHQDQQIDATIQVKKTIAPAIAFFGSEDPWKKGWDEVEAHLRANPNNKINVQLARGEKHGFFNKDPWQTVTLKAADDFLVTQGLLQGSSTLIPDTQYKLESDNE